jgi:hypothetical protein
MGGGRPIRETRDDSPHPPILKTKARNTRNFARKNIVLMTGATPVSEGVDLNFDPTRAYMTELGKFFTLWLKFSLFLFLLRLY